MSLRAQNADTASILSYQSRAPTVSTTRNTPIFTLESFSSKDFIVRDFVEGLSETAHPTRRSAGSSANTGTGQAAASQAFDPKPLIRTFEHALSRLKTLSEDLEVRENELSGSVRRAEGQHNANIKSRERELEKAIANFHRLERTLDGDGGVGGNAAMRIGERLEELDKQRQRAQDAKFILQCWLEVSERGDLSTLEDARKLGGGDGKVRCAHIARQLLRISQRLDPGTNGHSAPQTNGVHFANGVNGDHDDHSPNNSFRGKKGGKQPREIIEKFLEMLEKDLLKSFDDFYRRKNFDGMRECATALRDFSDGNSVVSLFVNQHEFFIDRAQLVTEDLATDTDIWDRLADPDTEPPGVEPSLQALIDEVKMVTQEESYILKRAFPYYEEVLARFTQRVFQQSLQQRLELVLNKADDISSLAFLRSLQASRSYIATLIEDLKAHGLTEHPEPASSMIAAVLDQQLDELFVPYFTGSSYIEREKRNLGELFEGLLFKFTMYHSRRRKMNVQTNTYLARVKELGSNVRENYYERLNHMDLPAGQKTIMLRLAGLHDKEQSSAAGQREIEVTEEDGQLSLPFTKRMLKWLAEGVGRGLELAGGANETPREVRELLQLLIANMGEIYLETALDAMNDAASAAESNTRSEPDLNYIADLRNAISILHLMLTTIHLLLLPLASSNLTIRRDLEKQTTTFIERMESKINTILTKTIDTALAWTSRLLSQQKKTDFRPKDDASLQLDSLNTSTCQNIYTFLSRLHARARTALYGPVLESFSLELAIGVRTLLLTHFKSYQVSLTGGLIVSKDITRYIELFKAWDLPVSFEPSLEVLTEIASIFVIGPEALRDRLRNVGLAAAGGALASVEKTDLRPYVLRREDSGSVGVQAVLSVL
ncbi:Exocyst complex component 5 [Vermiconidia calcicola]|uniref:Exocyst complex component 5 n=1 Tax=Vermiconidia calcicola TaxID=1690605 RepID=A0ACC3MHZ3_9PEZI|nr:Exocyst complex component 5 [Vermiconidia calcicola]